MNLKDNYIINKNSIALICILFCVTTSEAQFSGTLGGSLSSGLSSGLYSSSLGRRNTSTSNSNSSNRIFGDPNAAATIAADSVNTVNPFNNPQSTPFGSQSGTTNSSTTTMGDPGGPGGSGTSGGVNDSNVPLDGGLSLLLAFGVGAGYRKSRNKKINPDFI